MSRTPGAMEVEVNVVGSSTFGRYPKISLEKTYNMFISDGWLVNYAGFKKVAEAALEGEGRGIFHSIRGRFLLIVVSNIVYRVNENIDLTAVGFLESFSGEVFIDENLQSQICIVDGTSAYIYNHEFDSFTKQTLPFPPNYIVYHNTFFLFGNAEVSGNGAAWFIYRFDTPTTIVEVTSKALQTKPDYARAVIRLPGQGNNVLVFGSTVAEIWNNVGGLENYRRNSASNIDYGVLSVSTIASSDTFVVWLGINENNAPAIMVSTGTGAERLSSDGISFLLGSLKAPEKSTAFFYRQDGHLFYQLTFFDPRDNLTLIYDFSTKKFFTLSDQNINFHPARQVTYFNKKVYFVSLIDGSMYELSSELTTYDYGLSDIGTVLEHAIPRTRITKSIRLKNGEPFICNSFDLTLEQGNDPVFNGINEEFPCNGYLMSQDGKFYVDQTSGAFFVLQNSSCIPYRPRVDTSFSKNGGQSFSNIVGSDLNQEAFFKNVLSHRRLGQANELIFQLNFWGLDRFVVNNAVVEIYK